MKENTRVIHYDDLPQGGFAGIVEKHMVLNKDLWPNSKDRKDISHGFKDFIYLALGYFLPNDGAPLHSHKDVDIVSVVFKGSVGHKGTLGDGTNIHAPEVQVQRAGSGMQHSEFNLNDTPSYIAQIWFKPPKLGLSPNYKNFKLEPNKLTTVLGGKDGSFDNNMICKVGYLAINHKLELNQEFVVLITQGEATINNLSVKKGDLIEGKSMHLVAGADLGMLLIYENN